MSNQTKRIMNLYAEWERQGYYHCKNLEGIRNYLKWKFGKSCIICKNAEWQGEEIPLMVDHIDGNSTNGELSNYRLVCPNCDAQLPTYKGRNRGNGRHQRRQRYADGKSY